VNAAPVQDGRFKVYELPGGEYASIIHKGPFNTLSLALSALLKWIEDNGYRIIGPNREIYLYTGEGPAQQDDPTYVTENQFPVQKI
jgi:effector-binding domain-containing protein